MPKTAEFTKKLQSLIAKGLDSYDRPNVPSDKEETNNLLKSFRSRIQKSDNAADISAILKEFGAEVADLQMMKNIRSEGAEEKTPEMLHRMIQDNKQTPTYQTTCFSQVAGLLILVDEQSYKGRRFVAKLCPSKSASEKLGAACDEVMKERGIAFI